MLSDRDFRLWVKLLCVAADNNGRIPPITMLKHVLNARLDHLSTGVQRLVSGGLIDLLPEGYEPHDWSKLQYKSDTSTDRVHRHREKRNVSETPPEAETDTEAERSTAKAEHTRGDYHRLPEGWTPSRPLPPKTQTKIDQWPPGALEDELAALHRWAANASNEKGKGRKLDWDKAWVNWIERRHDDRYGKTNGRGAAADGLGVTARAAIAVFGPLERSERGSETGH